MSNPEAPFDDDSLARPSVEYLRETLPRGKKVSSELRRRATLLAYKRAAMKFTADGCTDFAAALTYYAVLSMFPALIALVSLLGVFGEGESTVNTIMSMLEGSVPQETMDFIKQPIEQLVNTPSAGLALVVGLLGALWSASGYVGAFSRVLNSIFEVKEGRPIWVLRPLLLGVTALMLVLVAVAALMLTVSGGVATTIFDQIGLGEEALRVWGWIKIPALLVIFVIVLAVMYQLTPNVRRPRFRILSLGGVTALVVLAIAILAFGIYLQTFSNYNQTYGSLAGIIMFLLMIWIANLALLFGAELDAELARSRQLLAGIAAEDEIQLPLVDSSGVIKAHEKRGKLIDEGASLRRDVWVEQARDEDKL
ncbi:YihY/virulence factor BrkB family protein [Dietzia sp.]|uniref:YihY/virulence factor BrkB family protein n=1 Tax=Dietzia sp. TaxID=1871616 RepID=UPI002FDA6AC7